MFNKSYEFMFSNISVETPFYMFSYIRMYMKQRQQASAADDMLLKKRKTVVRSSRIFLILNSFSLL